MSAFDVFAGLMRPAFIHLLLVCFLGCKKKGRINGLFFTKVILLFRVVSAAIACIELARSANSIVFANHFVPV